MLTAGVRVFISYSHDSPEHEVRVLALADRLRAEGVNAVLDQYQTAPPEGWQLWMEKQIRDANFVLLVCTETYRRRVMKEESPGRGLGVVWESSIIYQHLYNAGGVNEKFIPVVFGHGDTQHIPPPLQPTTYYDLGLEEGYENLYRRLTGQPGTPAPPLGKPRVLPPRPRPAPGAPPRPAARRVPNLVHPYALQANFTGRESERRELTAWLGDDAHSVCALVAMGGMGKSALAWYWLKNDALPAAAEVEGVMWWSFYEGEASFAKFIDEALKYVGGHPIDTARLPTTYDRAQELRQQLQTKRVLFVLDGFERQLRAYARLDAAYRRDDNAAPSREARACVEPEAVRLLQHIAAGTTRAKALLTTRLMPSDLEDRAGGALAGVLKRELKELPRDDAVAFMRAQGVAKGTSAEIAAVCAVYGNHPLSLRLLSGLIARDARMPGDIAAAPRHDVYGDLIQRQHHVLEQSYDALPEKARALLSKVAAFRNPMTYDALEIFNDFGDELRFDGALDELQARGLLQRDMARNRYDLHPLVRRYAYDRLSDRTGVHTRLRDYFQNVPVPDANKVRSLEDLAPVIELYHHTVSAGRYEEAVRLYQVRISDPLYFSLGAYQTEIELLRSLFPDGEDHPPRLKDESTQAWTLSELAASYSLSGQTRNSLRAYLVAISLVEKLDEKRNLAILLDAVGKGIHLPSGALALAEQNLLRSLKLAGEMEDEFREAVSHQEWGILLTYRGEFDEAERELDTALSMFEKQGYPHGVGRTWAYHGVRNLLMNEPRAALEAGQQARRFADEFGRIQYPVEREIIRAEWLTGVALIRAEEDLKAASEHLTDALTRCRRINLVDLEPDILLAWARWHRARGNPQEVRAYAGEALAVAERCEYRLKQAEIHNFLASFALDSGNRGAARQHAETARERAWCDGPPHCYKPALDEAEGILTGLAAEE